ncbi:MAG: GTPase Era, partial [Spirochaetaceae bacterium]|nr:GTPase Era [Spirochaetaceae bacterium]
MNESKTAKNAIVTIIGRPSAGKSTFLNTAAGEKVSIVSPVPQTTRNSIRGIINTSYGQLVFIDTPGYHNSEKKFNNKLKTIAEENLADSDLVLYLTDSTRVPGEEELLVAQLIKPFLDKTVIGINKIDLPESNPAQILSFLTNVFPDFPQERIVQISAANDTNINELLLQLYKLAPEGPAFYPEEYYTDQEVDFRISEIIRETAMNL